MEGSSYGERKEVINILSIDGGGIRGVIPATILEELESYLKTKAWGHDVRIADFFDVIAGTSTGSLVAAMLVTPSQDGRPRPAREIIEFYRRNAHEIFHEESKKESETGVVDQQHNDEDPKSKQSEDWFHKFISGLKNVGKQFESQLKEGVKFMYKRFTEAKYKSEPIRKSIKEVVKDTKLADIEKHLVIPTYDAREHSLCLFTTRKAKETHSQVKIADVLQGSTAAPFYFPPSKFEEDGRKFVLSDGGLAANDPTLLAIGEAKQAFPNQPEGYKHFRVLSLGTGRTKQGSSLLQVEEGNLAEMLLSIGFKNLPIIETFMRGAASATEMSASLLLGDSHSPSYPPRYLRIQDYDLHRELDSTDSPENIDPLINKTAKLLDEPVKALDCTTMSLQELRCPDDKGEYLTNKKALELFAETLVLEKMMWDHHCDFIHKRDVRT